MTYRMDPAAQARIDDAAAGLLANLAEDIVDDAQRIVRAVAYDTGDLHDSIRAEPVSKLHVRVVAGDEDVDYAAHVELGTRRMAAQPYLRPAALRKRAF